MKKLLLLPVLCLMVSCSEENIDKAEQIKKYYKGFQNGNFSQIREVLSDSLTITEGDYVMNFTPESYHEQFQWDSIFQPNYKLVSIENNNGQFEAKVAVESIRFRFLKNNPLTCSHRFHFDSGKISKIENLDCEDANWQIWAQERDSLVSWVKQNHPELDGFIYDLSMKGAQNYLRAIELYQKRY